MTEKNGKIDSGKYRRTHVTNDGKDVANGDGGYGNDDMKRRPRKKNRDQKQEKGDSRNGGNGSVVWTILVIGLVFSLVDVLYIMGFVERQVLVPVSVPVPVVSRPLPSVKHENSAKVENPAKADYPPPVVAEKAKAKKAKKSERKDVQSTGDGKATDTNDKGPIIDLIKRAGVSINPEEDKDLIDELPSWSEVVALYGPKPVIYGLDQCEVFQTHSDRADHFVSTAGTFNSGTNLMAELLIANCHMQDRMDKYGAINRGIRWQVPW